jgi:hypothetical protein
MFLTFLAIDSTELDDTVSLEIYYVLICMHTIPVGLMIIEYPFNMIPFDFRMLPFNLFVLIFYLVDMVLF